MRDDDGLDDYAEVVTYPTDPLDPDSDADGVSDGSECAGGCGDTDGDGLVDALDADDDGDGIGTVDEDLGDGDPTNDDTDGT